MFWWECTSWIGSNCVAKANLKGAPGIDITTLASKADLTSLKTKVDNLDADKLKTILADLRKWSNVKDNDVVKKSVCDKVVIKSVLLVLRYQVLLDYSLKHCMIRKNKLFRRRLRMLAKDTQY